MSIRPEDFVRYRTISAPSMSPDGRKVAVSIQQADMKEDGYLSDVWVVGVDGADMVRLTSGAKDSGPVWGPDGNILFLSRRGMQKEEKGTGLYVISPAGGEATLLLRRKEGIESPEWSPDSRSILFVSSVTEQGQEDVKVVRRMRLWFNGEGYIFDSTKHLFRLDAQTGQVEQVTAGNFDVRSGHFSPDGRKVGYLLSSDETRPYIADLYVKDLATGEVKKLTDSDMGIDDFDWSPDGAAIAFNGGRLTSGFSSHSHIWVVEADGSSKPRQVDQVDRNKANSLNSDARTGSHGPTAIIWEGEHIYYCQSEGGSAHVCRVSAGGDVELVVGGERSVEGMDVRGGQMAFVSMDSHHLEELYIWKGEERKLTDVNATVYRELDVLEPKGFKFRASDGEEVEGWVMLPESAGRVPGVLYVHGGPKTSFGHSYMHEFQVFAAGGYAMIYVNPRGSDGYSEKFADIRGSYGKRDFQDLMEALDYALEEFPMIDGERLGIAGGSYGGFMTNWAIGHTDRFKAAVTDRSIASWLSFFGTSDIGPEFTKDQIGADPWSDEELLLEFSPLRYAKDVNTPLLVVHSMEDYRCWMVEGLEMFTALKYLGKETELVLFPEENHDLSRKGRPKHRAARLGHYMRWFDAHLKTSK